MSRQASRKGELTRQAILERAARTASRVGLAGLTIGELADELQISKSGLFAHFGSKESLQLGVLEFGAQRFVETVVRPTLAAPRGEPRVRELFERWLGWPAASGLAGCIFVAFSTELDDRSGPVRERLVQLERDWLEMIATCFRTGASEGHFRADLDAEQCAHELHGIMLACHHGVRLLRDEAALTRTRRAFERLLEHARTGSRA